MGLTGRATTLRPGRIVVGALVLGVAFSLAACGKRGPLSEPQEVVGVDEDGKKIRQAKPPPPNKPFILDPILF